MEFQDYYQTLGVPRTASQAEIKKAFRKLARESHPDKHPGDKAAEGRFKALNEANAVLSDPAKRDKYDRFGRDWEAYARAGAAAGAAGGSGARDPFGAGGPFARYASGGASAAGPGGIRYEFCTSGDAGAFSDFFRMMFGDEGAAVGEPEAFSAGSRGSLDDMLAGMGVAGAGGGRGRAPGGPGRTRDARLAPARGAAARTPPEARHARSRNVG